MTLRCRKCRFAFYFEDGLTDDPTATPEPVAVAAAAQKEIAAVEDPPTSPFESLDDNYDDILDVLETPDTDPLAPPRAHASQSIGLDELSGDETSEPQEPEPVRQPVTHQQLRSHRNARQIWMLMSFLFACALCAICVFSSRNFVDQSLSKWERRMLYAMGAPARLLPPQLEEDELLLPVNHVKLRGDHIELADRDDFYRDDFPSDDPASEPAEIADGSGKVDNRVAKKPATKVVPPKVAARKPIEKEQKIKTAKPPVKPRQPKPKIAKPESKPKPKELQLQDVAVNSDDLNIHEVDRSPPFLSSIVSMVPLPENRFALLSDEGKLAIASRTTDGWSATSLKIDSAMEVTGFDITDDATKIVLRSKDQLQAWEILDTETGKAKFVSDSAAHTVPITHLRLTNDGSKIISGDATGKLYVSDFESGRRISDVQGFGTKIKYIVPKGKTGFVAMDERGITKGARNKVTSFGTRVLLACCLSDNGSKMAFQQFGAVVKIADINGQKFLGSVDPDARVFVMSFSSNQKYLLLQARGETSVWDWKKGERLRVFRYPGKATVPAAVSEDGKTVAIIVGEDRNQISVFQLPGVEKE